MHPLDNVIWQALTTRQSHFAQTRDQARRFIPEVGPLGALSEWSDAAFTLLEELVAPGGTVGLFFDDPHEIRLGWTFVAGAPLLQMIYDAALAPTSPPPKSDVNIIELGLRDSPEMIQLTALTKPGPFSTRTHELGLYLGIRDQGKLVAMAGERLKVPGHTEVSAVCTHPNHTGRGYAAVLMTAVMTQILAHGETPFLHVREDNVRAIEVYKRLGFQERKLGHFAVLRRV